MESVSVVNDSALIHQVCLSYFNSRNIAPVVHPRKSFQLVVLEHTSSLGGSDIFFRGACSIQVPILVIGRHKSSSFIGLDLYMTPHGLVVTASNSYFDSRPSAQV